jgi:hypothetical protein
MIGPEETCAAPAAAALKKPIAEEDTVLQEDDSISPPELSRLNSFSSLKSIDSRTSFQGLALPDVCYSVLR